jgi:hypothetical protein
MKKMLRKMVPLLAAGLFVSATLLLSACPETYQLSLDLQLSVCEDPPKTFGSIKSVRVAWINDVAFGPEGDLQGCVAQERCFDSEKDGFGNLSSLDDLYAVLGSGALFETEAGAAQGIVIIGSEVKDCKPERDEIQLCGYDVRDLLDQNDVFRVQLLCRSAGGVASLPSICWDGQLLPSCQ